MSQISLNITGVVLAGGNSSRMGRDKAGLSYKGQTLLQYQFEKMKATNQFSQIVVSGDFPEFEHVLDFNITKGFEEIDEKKLGPLAGLYSVMLKYSKASAFVFLPVDMPLLSVELLARQCQAFGNKLTDTTLDAVIFSNHELPVLLRNTDFVKNQIKELFNSRERKCSVRGLLNSLTVHQLTLADSEQHYFLNVNSTEDWSRVE